MAPSEGCAGLAILAAFYHSGVSLLQRWCWWSWVLDHGFECSPTPPKGGAPIIITASNEAGVGIERCAVSIIRPIGDGSVVQDHHTGHAESTSEMSCGVANGQNAPHPFDLPSESIKVCHLVNRLR